MGSPLVKLCALVGAEYLPVVDADAGRCEQKRDAPACVVEQLRGQRAFEQPLEDLEQHDQERDQRRHAARAKDAVEEHST